VRATTWKIEKESSYYENTVRDVKWDQMSQWRGFDVIRSLGSVTRESARRQEERSDPVARLWMSMTDGRKQAVCLRPAQWANEWRRGPSWTLHGVVSVLAVVTGITHRVRWGPRTSRVSQLLFQSRGFVISCKWRREQVSAVDPACIWQVCGQKPRSRMHTFELQSFIRVVTWPFSRQR
jgi:hypothetical protein